MKNLPFTQTILKKRSDSISAQSSPYYFQMEKVMPNQWPVSLNPSEIVIADHAVVDADHLKVRGTGPIDLIRVESLPLTMGPNYTDLTLGWRIEAHPEKFEHLKIPRLEKYLNLPNGMTRGDLFENFNSVAFSSGQYDY